MPTDRRTFLTQLFGFVVGIAGALHLGSASAARRGHSSANLLGGGYVIAVTAGRVPGEIETAVYGAAGGRAIIFTNLTEWDIETEVIPPDSGPSTTLLRSSWSLRVPIDHPGTARWRVWRTGDTPGDYQIIDYGS
jgi:hypothetical protein